MKNYQAKEWRDAPVLAVLTYSYGGVKVRCTHKRRHEDAHAVFCVLINGIPCPTQFFSSFDEAHEYMQDRHQVGNVTWEMGYDVYPVRVKRSWRPEILHLQTGPSLRCSICQADLTKLGENATYTDRFSDWQDGSRRGYVPCGSDV
jgi:hypothetical protein